MHLLIQTTATNLRDKVSEHYDPEAFEWRKSWEKVGPKRYVATFPSGQAAIFGPIRVQGTSFWEIQVTAPGVIDDINPEGRLSLKRALRRKKGMRAVYRALGRRFIRNKYHQVVGVLPDFVIAGTDPREGFLGDEDPDDAEPMSDLESE